MWINFYNPVAVTDGKEVEAKKVKQAIYKARQQVIQSTVSEERWQGKLINNRWDDEEVKLNSLWKNAPTHTIAGVQGLYQQLLPTKVYYNRRATTEKQNHRSLMKNAAYEGIPWRMCSTFYLAVVHWHRLSSYRDITMLSRSYSLKSTDL